MSFEEADESFESFESFDDLTRIKVRFEADGLLLTIIRIIAGTRVQIKLLNSMDIVQWTISDNHP